MESNNSGAPVMQGSARTIQGREERVNLVFSGAGFQFKICETSLGKIVRKIQKGKMSEKDFEVFVQKRLKHNTKNLVSGTLYEEDLQAITADIRDKYHI